METNVVPRVVLLCANSPHQDLGVALHRLSTHCPSSLLVPTLPRRRIVRKKECSWSGREWDRVCMSERESKRERGREPEKEKLGDTASHFCKMYHFHSNGECHHHFEEMVLAYSLLGKCAAFCLILRSCLTLLPVGEGLGEMCHCLKSSLSAHIFDQVTLVLRHILCL